MTLKHSEIRLIHRGGEYGLDCVEQTFVTLFLCAIRNRIIIYTIAVYKYYRVVYVKTIIGDAIIRAKRIWVQLLLPARYEF